MDNGKARKVPIVENFSVFLKGDSLREKGELVEIGELKAFYRTGQI